MKAFRILPVAVIAVLASIYAFAESQAQPYPSRSVTLVVPYPAGGLSDIPARALAAELQNRLGAPFIIENRVGGSGTVGTAYAASAAPDGYTLFVNSVTDVTNRDFMTLKYDILTDFAPIAMIVEGPPLVLAVNSQLPFKTVAELVDYARQNPGKLNFGSSGPGSAPSIAAAMLKVASKTEITEVPYRGTSLVALAVAAGEIQAAFVFQSSVEAMMKDGRIRILASTAPKRTANLQNIPTMIESGFPDFDFQGFVGLAAPAKTSPEIINLLNKHVNEIVRGESFRARFAPFGMQPIANNTPADFDAYLRREIERNHARAKLSKTQ